MHHSNHWFSGLKLVVTFMEVSPLSTNFRCFFSAVEFHHWIPPLESQRNQLEHLLEEAAGGIPFLYTASQLANLETEKTVSMLKIQIGQWKKTPWLFRVYIGEYTTQLYREKIINHRKDPHKPTSIMKSRRVFCSLWLKCAIGSKLWFFPYDRG